jgi:ribonuclease R
VTVRLVEAAPVAGALRFEMLSDGRKDGRRGQQSFHKSQRGAPNARPPHRKRRR